MLDYNTLKPIIQAALTDAAQLLAEVETNEVITPGNYDGDGEAFAFQFNTEFDNTEDYTQAREVYLAAFWVEMEHLQEPLLR